MSAFSASAQNAIVGYVEAPDTRFNPYQQVLGFFDAVPPGARQPVGGGESAIGTDDTKRMDGVLVRAFVYQTSTIYSTFFARTDDNGLYYIDWSVGFTPVKVVVSVVAQRADMSDSVTATVPPGAEFRFNNVTTVLDTKTFIGAFSGFRTVNFDLVQASETVNAYFTFEEIYELFDDQGTPFVGGTTRNDMEEVEISINSNGTSGGITPTDTIIYIQPGLMTTNPWVGAHELGHMLAWRSYDHVGAPISRRITSASTAQGRSTGIRRALSARRLRSKKRLPN